MIGKPLRVAPGDTVVLRARLPAAASLGRLAVFAREGENEQFSPYIPDLAAKIGMVTLDNKPPILQPMTMRLTARNPLRVIKFVSDIDGRLCVMQEVDSLSDKRVLIKFSRTIAPQVPWPQRFKRHLSELWA